MSNAHKSDANLGDGGPAFPLSITMVTPAGQYQEATMMSGMTLLDYFAGRALTGMLAYSHINPASGNWTENCEVPSVAAAAYSYAEAMLAEKRRRELL